MNPEEVVVIGLNNQIALAKVHHPNAITKDHHLNAIIKVPHHSSVIIKVPHPNVISKEEAMMRTKVKEEVASSKEGLIAVTTTRRDANTDSDYTFV